MNWTALFTFIIANLIACTACAQAPFPGQTTQKGPAGSTPGVQATMPGTAAQGGPAENTPGTLAPMPGTATPNAPAENPAAAPSAMPGAQTPDAPAGSPATAPAPIPGAAAQSKPTGTVPGADEIMTAIDASDLITRGFSDAAIAVLLSNRWGFDRESAIKKGWTDEQIIRDLVTKTKKLPPVGGVNRLKQHEDEGDKLFRNSNYGGAAKEYSLAIAYSEQSDKLYQLRAETYVQYLKTVLFPAAQSRSFSGKQAPRDRSRSLLCHAIRYDYATASDLNKKYLEALNADIYLLAERIKKDPANNESDGSTGRIAPMARFRHLERLKKDAIQTGVKIRKSMDHYKPLCEAK